jgi:hypothetical protein
MWRGNSRSNSGTGQASSFRQEGVVGVGEAAPGDRPGLGERHAVLVDEEPQELDHGQGRMGVVELNDRGVGQARERAALGQVPAQQVLQGSRGEEEFLP